MELTLRNDRLLLEEKDQYRTEIAKYKLKCSQEKNDYISDLQTLNEHMKKLVVGLNSMNESHCKLQQDIKRLQSVKEKRIERVRETNPKVSVKLSS